MFVNCSAGSPFSIWASSASLLRVTGPGIEHGVLATFKSVFEVDATEAGPGDLKVRVGGRRGKLSERVLCHMLSDTCPSGHSAVGFIPHIAISPCRLGYHTS